MDQTETPAALALQIQVVKKAIEASSNLTASKANLAAFVSTVGHAMKLLSSKGRFSLQQCDLLSSLIASSVTERVLQSENAIQLADHMINKTFKSGGEPILIQFPSSVF